MMKSYLKFHSPGFKADVVQDDLVAKSLAASGIRYILDGGAYLNFTQLDRADDCRNFILSLEGVLICNFLKGRDQMHGR